jgi:hypothetical protein
VSPATCGAPKRGATGGVPISAPRCAGPRRGRCAPR